MMNPAQLGENKENKITHDRTGKLQDLAVEYFQRAYGLGDRPREDHNELCEEAVQVTQCSRRAFRELIYGHSYQAILGPLRDMVPGYKPKLPKREQREQQMQELEQLSMSGSMGGTPPDAPVPRPAFKLSTSATPFESPKMLPQPQTKYVTTLSPTGSVTSMSSREPSMAREPTMGGRELSMPASVPSTLMVKPKLADRVLTSPERKSKLAGVSPEPMDLPAGSFSRSSESEGVRSEWGSPIVWPSATPSDTPRRETPPKPRSGSNEDKKAVEDKLKEEKTREEKAANDERLRGEARAREEQALEDQRARGERQERETAAVRMQEETRREREKEDETKESKQREAESDEQEPGMIEEALRDKAGRVLSRQDKVNRSRTPRPFRSPQLAPSLFATPIQPPVDASASTTSEVSLSSSALMANFSRFGVFGMAAVAALGFCVLRQYVLHIANYSGAVSLETFLPMLFGSFGLLAVLVHRVLHSAIETRALPMAIATDTEDYIEAWELLHVGGDSRELVHALQQIQLLLESLVQGLDVFHTMPAAATDQTRGGVNHSVRLLDYLSSIHRKLAGDIGNTVLVMRLVDSLRRIRMSLLKLCLASAATMPILEQISACIAAVNVVTLMVGVQRGSALFEVFLLPSFVFLFALVQLLITHLDSPFSPVAPLNLESLVYIQKRVQNRIVQLQKAAE